VRFCFNLLRGVFATAAAIMVTGALGADGSAPPVVWPTEGWQASTPEQQGMASDAVRRLLDFGAANEVDSLLLVRHGKLVVDAYYAPYRSGIKHVVNSTTKAVMGTLIGVAVQDGLLKDTSQPMLAFLGDKTGAGLAADKQAITVQHLLDMTSGLDWKEPLDGLPESMLQMRRSPDWLSFVLGRPMAQAPGASFNYNSGNSQLLSAVLTKLSGRSAADFARERLFEPLGITDTVWRQDPQGLATGGFGLYLHPRDMAKIGYLYLHKGMWQDRQLLPPNWTDTVTRASIDMHQSFAPALRYANGWWVFPERGIYMAVGYHRQLIVVLPKYDMVAVLTGKSHYSFDLLLGLLEASASTPIPLSENKMAQAELAKRVLELATEQPSPVGPPPELANRISGQVYRFGPNALGLQSMVLDLRSATPGYELRFQGAGAAAVAPRVVAPVGLDGRLRTTDLEGGRMLATKANWIDGQTLAMVSHAIGDGEVNHYTLRFGAGTVDVSVRHSSGFKTELRGVTEP